MSEPVIGKFYRHFKGGLYTVLFIGTHTESEEVLVVYRHVSGNVYCRPIDSWRTPARVEGEPVARGGPPVAKQVERFTLLPDDFKL